MIFSFLKSYLYVVASIVLFAGLFVAIPLTYNLENMSDASARAEVVRVDDLSLELTYLS